MKNQDAEFTRDFPLMIICLVLMLMGIVALIGWIVDVIQYLHGKGIID